MTTIDPIYIGDDAINQLIAYCEREGLKQFVLIADTNTFRVLGERVESALTGAGCEVVRVVLEGDEVIADERYLIKAMVRAPLGDYTFLAVGSGTLTDITRFVSYYTGRSFISLPTAPSVDGFTSTGAPVVLEGVKQTIFTQPPRALFADLDTLCNAPRELIAAGFGDMLGKISSLADWRLGALLWDEPYDEAIARRAQIAVDECVSSAQAVGQRSPEGIRRLMDALIESGLCMLELGNSRPASGAEHHASHYWEMQLLLENRPAILHGAKVAYALSLVAQQYDKIRDLSRQEALDRLEAAELPQRAAEIESIRQGYGKLADGVIREHAAFLDMTPEQFEQLKQRVAENWDAVQEIAGSLPPSEQVVGYLQQAGAPTDAAALGLDPAEVERGLLYGHYLRNRFTVMKLSRVLGLPLSPTRI
jgi:glycerol-1-phosphate dehydrogenase [NAD(P)+]